MYEILEISMADLPRLYQYHQQEQPWVKFSLKGFDYPWLLTSRKWKADEKVLDVGAAYSPMPLHIQKTFGCELWAVDDYGLSSDEEFWQRGASPREYIADHPEVKFIVERVGDPERSSLPANYFDVIYSISTLEHVSGGGLQSVWKHMDSLLKPGGEMLHAVDIAFPSNGGPGKILMAVGLDALYPFLPKWFKEPKSQGTPRAFVRLAFSALGIHHRIERDLSVVNMVLNPEVLAESYHYGLKRMAFDGFKDYRYQRVGSLLIHLKKLEYKK